MEHIKKIITNHKFIDKYPIDKKSEKLILGTIHPHKTSNFKIDFYYGNVLSIWKIFKDVFPDELKELDLDSILKFLKLRKISVSDTIISCERKTETALDKDLIPIKLNLKLLDEIKNSNISEILFTSGFGKNNAFKLFYEDILGEKITKEIISKREVKVLHPKIGRELKLTILYSPSGASNVGISRSKLFLENKEKYSNSPKKISEFKKAYYKEKFSS
jgi:G:T/U-mismatch repair DNA glycosylase